MTLYTGAAERTKKIVVPILAGMSLVPRCKTGADYAGLIARLKSRNYRRICIARGVASVRFRDVIQAGDRSAHG